MLNVVVTAGGTGGHIIPAINIANCLKSKIEANVYFFGSKGGMEEHLSQSVVMEGLKFVGFNTPKLHRGNLLKNVSLPFKLISSVSKAHSCLKKFKVSVVVGSGGYASLPAVLASKLSKVKLFLQEQNALPGLATKVAVRFCDVSRIYLGYEEAFNYLNISREKVYVTGNPIRIPNVNIDSKTARKRFSLKDSSKTIFVTGGSQGAKRINQAIEGCFESLVKNDFNIIWQTGSSYTPKEDLKSKYPENLRIAEFLSQEEMQTAYTASDIAITRSGAMTLSELAYFGLPAILIPLPTATEGHQEKNALVLQNKAAAKVLLEKDLSENSLIEKIMELSEDKVNKDMRENMQKLHHQNALENIVEDIIRNINA